MLLSYSKNRKIKKLLQLYCLFRCLFRGYTPFNETVIMISPLMCLWLCIAAARPFCLKLTARRQYMYWTVYVLASHIVAKQDYFDFEVVLPIFLGIWVCSSSLRADGRPPAAAACRCNDPTDIGRVSAKYRPLYTKHNLFTEFRRIVICPLGPRIEPRFRRRLGCMLYSSGSQPFFFHLRTAWQPIPINCTLNISKTFVISLFFFTFMWPCIVTNFFIIKPTRCTNFTNLFWHETLHVSDSSSVHHQEFIHCTLSIGICHTGL